MTIYLKCSLSLEPKVILGMSQLRQNSRVLRLWAATEQPTAKAAATFSPLDVGGLAPGVDGGEVWILTFVVNMFLPFSFLHLPVGESRRPSAMRSVHRLLQVPLGLKAVWWLICLSGCGDVLMRTLLQYNQWSSKCFCSAPLCPSISSNFFKTLSFTQNGYFQNYKSMQFPHWK